MNVSLILAIAALACAVFLAVQVQSRLFPVVASAVAAIEVLMALGIVRLAVSGIPLGLVLAIALAVAGALCWVKAQPKLHVSAATIILIVGALQVLTAIRR
ncbi:MAG: hypothetical protein WBV82_18625 [Myxococcaceae bacterium]